MPLKEFICRDCGHVQEHLIPQFSDVEDIPPCDHCDSNRLEKLFSVTGGYKMNSGGSSVRPKSAGSRPKGAK